MARQQPRSGQRPAPQRRIKAALCVTCLVDQFYPQVGEATVRVLRRQGVDVAFPESQTCCGQVAFNGGFRTEAAALARRFLDVFAGDDYVVVPSGSCASMIKVFYPDLFADDPAMLERANKLADRTHEFSSFLVNVLGVTDVGASYRGTVTYHDACHLLRELRIGQEPRTLIDAVDGLELREMPHSDACCGFGGLFSVKFPDISAAILDDKLRNVQASGATVLVANDCGCLMHLAGAMARRGIRVRAVHLAELLASTGGVL